MWWTMVRGPTLRVTVGTRVTSRGSRQPDMVKTVRCVAESETQPPSFRIASFRIDLLAESQLKKR